MVEINVGIVTFFLDMFCFVVYNVRKEGTKAMWKNTSRSVLKQKNISEKPENKVLSKPPIKSGVDFILPGGFGGWGEYGPDETIATYATILRVLSESFGKLPIHIRDSEHKIVQCPAERLLTIRPCEEMSPCQLFTFLTYSMVHYGNAYAFCDWSNATGELRSITALDPRCVRIWVDDVSNEILKKYYYTYTTPSGNSYILASEDVVHVRVWHVDEQTRMVGIPVRNLLYELFAGEKAAAGLQTDMYRSGMVLTGVLNYVGDLSDEKKQLLLENIKKIGTKNKILPLPQDWKLSTINMSMADSQFVEGRKLNALQMAAAYGVMPNQLNDYSKGSYANATAQQLAFLQDTLQYISRQYEDELTFKLLSDKEIEAGLRVDVDTDALLKSTPDVLADILCKYVTGSVMTINEAREKAGLPPYKGGDKLMTMPGATTLKEEVIV